jgi:DNA polymerase I-like protein with 3'-5' exonuclease and polymerase domains
MTNTPQWAAFDVETTITDGEAGAWRLGNRVVLSGEFHEPGQPYITEDLAAWHRIERAIADGRTIRLAGHNLTFDLCHALRADPTSRALHTLLAPNLILWDTQIVDFLISGCANTWATLEESGARFGVPIAKDPWASEAFAKGIGADVLCAQDAPRLRHYLESDLVGTLALAKAQYAHVTENATGLRRVIQTQMQVVKFVVLCQHYGMPIDARVLHDAAALEEMALTEAETQLRSVLHALIPHPFARSEFNLNSPTQLKALLYGGTVVYTQRTEIGKYKTGARIGAPRYRLDDVPIEFPALIPQFDGASTKESALQIALANISADDPARALIGAILAVREHSKLVTTYYRPIAAKLPISHGGNLYGDLNMAATNTGRKSSSNPNLQNIPDSVRESIKAPPGYVIMAVDAKQLEVIGLGYMSRCPDLREALKARKDIHGIVKTRSDGLTGKDTKRTDIKRVVFGRFYGGGAKTLSGQSGVPMSIVQTIVSELDNAFPGAARFYKRVKTALIRNQRARDHSFYTLPSGRLLRFDIYPEDKDFGFSEMKNRPIQSFATADVIPFVEMCLLKWLAENLGLLTDRRVLPLVTVHDEIVLLVRADTVQMMRDYWATFARECVTRLNAWFKLSPPLDLPLDFSLGVGDTWKAAKEAAETITYEPI